MMVQPKNYDYIGLAGQQAAQGIRNVSNVMQQEKKVKETKFDLATLEDARQKKIEEAYNEYLEASGDESNEGKRKAYNYASQIFPPATGKERDDPNLMRDRLIDADKNHYMNLANIKEKRYYKETGTEKLGVETEKLGGEVSTGSPVVSGASSGNQQTVGTRQPNEEILAGMQRRELYAPPTTPNVEIPSSMNAEDRYDLAKKYQIMDKPGVSNDIAYASQREFAGQEFPESATMETAARAAAEYPESTRPMEQIVSSYPKQKDVMTDRRLSEAADARQAAAEERNRIAAAKVAIQNRTATEDDMLKWQNSKESAMQKRLKLESDILTLKANLAKANKTDEYGEPVLNQESVNKLTEEIAAMQTRLDNVVDFEEDWKENISEYNRMMKSKGHIPQPSTKPPQQVNPSRAGFDAWKANRGQ